MTTIPAGWWLVGSGAVPVAPALLPGGVWVVAVAVAIAAALAVCSACRPTDPRRG